MADDLLRIDFGLRYDGPLFDFRARRAFRDMKQELQDEAAEYVEDHIRGTYHREFRNPTGYYESNVRVTSAGSGVEVSDGGWGGPVYGPWLEGVGSRNETTRFKGYHAFRRAAQALDRRIEDMGDRMFRVHYRHRVE